MLILKRCNVRLASKHLGRLVHLRHLNLMATGMMQLPASIGKLKELRYLDLSSTNIRSLPETVASLTNLRKLNVQWCKSLRELPKRIVSLPRLQVIDLGHCHIIEDIPKGILAMASLRQMNIQGRRGLKKLPKEIRRRNDVLVRLDRFPIAAAGRDAGGGCRSNIRVLGGPNIIIHPRWWVDIRNLEEVGSRDEARTAKLDEKTLSSLFTPLLGVRGTRTRSRSHGMDGEINIVAAQGVLEGLHPPQLLMNVKIRDA